MGLADRVVAGEWRAAARLMRDLDDGLPGARQELARLHGHTGRAHVVGVTGSPGAGKSTLCSALITAYRRAQRTVGVVAVDPSSPFTGGAILGDRIRMQEHACDPGVFIRSLATRGALGGLSRSATDVVSVLDAMGMDVVLVETVGVGQDEVDIARLADTTVVVSVPGMGDDVQSIKAGILEIADVLVVNKADHDGADRTARDLETMVHMRDGSAPARAPASGLAGGGPWLTRVAAPRWEPPVVMVVATTGQGVDELVAQVARHRADLSTGGGLHERQRARARSQVLTLAREKLLAAALRELESQGGLEALVAQVAERRTDPESAASGWVARVLGV
jgi:LAO/AO transport system kinase